MDIILVGNGDNIILGGFGGDQITGGNGRDVVVGDNGNVTFDAIGVLIGLLTTDASLPGDYDDIVLTGNGFNTVLGGTGADTITGGEDTDVVLGDNGSATFINASGLSLLQLIVSTDDVIGGYDIINVGNGRNSVIGGFGADQITSGINQDTVIGDNGRAVFNTTGILTYITTTETSIGDIDVINAGNGDNVVIGGFGGDQITGGNGRDVVLGDNGNAEFNDAADLIFVTTTDPTIGGDDLINAGDGDNIVLAGFGADEVFTGLHDDIVVGDNGYATFNNSDILVYVTTTQPEIGGDDLIDAGDGHNIVLGGYGSDQITSGAGEDVAVGDNGYAVFSDAGVLTYITTSSPEIGGDDLIETGGAKDIVIGGQGEDTIDSGAGDDSVLGDNGYAEFNLSGSLTFLTTTNFDLGVDDFITAGSGDDLVLGGSGNDEIYGGIGHDTLIGDQGYWSHLLDSPRLVELIDETIPSDDRIFGGDGMDLILSGGGDDWNEGGNDNDTIFAGYGDDFLWGGEGKDRMTGGPGGDWIDGGFGGDLIYVDVFDTWATGFPQDTVIMGRMTTTGLKFNNDLIRNYGDADAGDSAAFNVISSLQRLLESTRTQQVVLLSMDEDLWASSSSILENAGMDSLLNRSYNIVRWSGGGSSIYLLSIDRMGGPQLIGISDFIEQQWNDLLPIYY